MKKLNLKIYFRKDNLKFISKLFIDLLGLIISNVSLINIGNWKDPIFLMCALVYGVLFAYLMLLLFRKYEYYHSLVSELQEKDNPLFLMCAFIAKFNQQRRDIKSIITLY